MSANTGLGLGFAIRLERLPRSKCAICHRRRVLFALLVSVGVQFAPSRGLCYDCMAPRRQAPTLHYAPSFFDRAADGVAGAPGIVSIDPPSIGGEGGAT